MWHTLKKVHGAITYAYDLYMRHQDSAEAVRQIAYRGEGSIIEEGVQISWPSRLRIGHSCLVQRDVILHSQGGIHIGDCVGVGSRSIMVSFNHNYMRPERLPYDDKIVIKPIIIRDYVWIGFDVKIMPGIEIGEGAIVGMGSVVTKNVPPCAVVLGNPAVLVGHRDKSHFENLRRDHPRPETLKTISYKEDVPLMTRRRYEKELKELGLLPEE